MSKKAHELLAEASKTYKAKNAVYGDNYLRVGNALAALFPNGVTLKTADDFNRFHIFALMVVKQSRYCVNWDSGGHQDSVHDNTVYSAILEEIDEGIKDREALEQEPVKESTLLTDEDMEELSREWATPHLWGRPPQPPAPPCPFDGNSSVVVSHPPETTHYVYRQGHSGPVFVKEKSFFFSQKGHIEKWGKAWRPVVASSESEAREIGEHLNWDVLPAAKGDLLP